ncbi:hypothetical protein PISMIDRAFT_292796 [Pisolithus microcarpus 441]|uniref:Uncharacterized protein n=1 Tax=Pisolithus microcarpus 441 TaxID=765257 RepID=A0A0C9YPC3_9AGAM|nr:hypothetical protein PISMIDRAFT_292796 [Pisolithus microcarpus 441]
MHLGDDVKTSSAVRKGIEILEQRGRAFACRKWSVARSPYYIMGMSCMQCTTYTASAASVVWSMTPAINKNRGGVICFRLHTDHRAFCTNFHFPPQPTPGSGMGGVQPYFEFIGADGQRWP